MEFAVSSSDEWDVKSGYLSESDGHALSQPHGIEHHTVDESDLYDNEDDDDSDVPVKWIYDEPVLKFSNLAFVLISFGYMLPWTSLGSLISYYKYNYSANFYVKLYCGYYLPGLPVALLQLRFDNYFDKCYGSQRMYLIRGVLSFIVMILILLSMIWVQDRWALFFLFVLLGVCGWLCHGTASMLASMHPAASIAYLQTGFRCPEIYTVAAVALLHIGKDPTKYHLDLFYIITAAVVFIGLFSWIYVVESQRSTQYFDGKDNKLQTVRSSETQPLFANKLGTHRIRSYEEINDANQQPSPIDLDKEAAVVDGLPSSDKSPLVPVFVKPLERAKKLLQAVEDKTMKEVILKEILPLGLALYITIFCSIFQASFFAYVDSPQGRDIEQILYFVRLFSDLLGRPLTRLPRPFFMTKKHHVLVGSILRVFLVVVFFAYIIVPNFPKSDLWITALVSVFSILSGYFTVLIYEFAAHSSREMANKQMQTYATAVLNICFQLAAFTAVLSSVYITNSGWFERFET